MLFPQKPDRLPSIALEQLPVGINE